MSTATHTQPTTETLTRRTACGTIYALSSDGHTEYTVSLSPARCQCQGFQRRSRCRHLTAAIVRYAAVGQWIELPDPQEAA